MALPARPRALVSYFGYGDIVGPWYSQPDEFYRHQPLVSKEDARAAVGTAPISDPPQGNERNKFYLYCRQNGVWPMQVSGHDPHAEDEWFTPYYGAPDLRYQLHGETLDCQRRLQLIFRPESGQSASATSSD